MFWTRQAYFQQFVLPALKPVYETFKELAKTGVSAEEILVKLKEKFEDLSFIYFSFEELLGDECMDSSVDLKASEVLELIHTKEGYTDCDSSRCKYQREKLKKKV